MKVYVPIGNNCSGYYEDDISATLTTKYHYGGGGDAALIIHSIDQTVATKGEKGNMCTCYAIENHPADSRVSIDDSGIVQTLSARMGTGGNNTPMVLIRGNDE